MRPGLLPFRPMKNSIPALLLSIMITLSLSCSGPVADQKEKEERKYDYIMDYSFVFSLPAPAAEDSVTLRFLRLVNPCIQFYGLVEPDSGKGVYSLIVSKYENNITVSLDTAFFKYTVNLAEQLEMSGARQIGYSRFTIKDKTYYRKLSCHADTMLHVMYYFMKNNFDNTLYELKLSGNIEDSTRAINFLHHVAEGVHFINTDWDEDFKTGVTEDSVLTQKRPCQNCDEPLSIQGIFEGRTRSQNSAPDQSGSIAFVRQFQSQANKFAHFFSS